MDKALFYQSDSSIEDLSAHMSILTASTPSLVTTRSVSLSSVDSIPVHEPDAHPHSSKAQTTPQISAYQPGRAILLNSGGGKLVEAEIVEIKSNTFSSVMTIRSSEWADLRILKLYDRRFAEELREQLNITPIDQAAEDDFCRLVLSGQVQDKLDHWTSQLKDMGSEGQPLDDDADDWDDGTLEAWLQFLCFKFFCREKRAYDILKDLQGTCIPTIYNAVTVHDPQTVDWSMLFPFTRVYGLLMENIAGTPLTDMAENFAPSYWPSTVERAVEIIHRIGDHGICNRDVNTRSFILTQPNVDAPHSGPGLFMIDFGLCSFEDEFENHEEFRRAQAYQDEERAISAVMWGKLKKIEGNTYTFKETERAAKLSYDFMREELWPMN